MKKTFISLGVILILLILSTSSYAYWIWTPKTGKWLNPRQAVKPTPGEQLEYALKFYNSADYNRGIREFRKILKKYPLSTEAPLAQYYIGLCLEGQGGYYEAFLAYEKVLKKYPHNQKVKDIVEREYRIANLFYSGEKIKVMGMSLLSAKDKAIEIFRKVIDNDPYGQYADLSQYKIGLMLKQAGRYEEAKSAFAKIPDEYPDSALADDARYQIAICSFNTSLESDYDQKETDIALRELEYFLKKYPQSELSPEAAKLLQALRDKKAEKAFGIARFYERQGNANSALVYYEDVVTNFPNSHWAAKALERLQVIKREEK